MDGGNDIYVGSSGDNAAPYSVSIFAAGANGNVAPTQYISGSRTKLSEPVGVAIR